MHLRLIDTHAHLNFSAYKNDRAEVFRRALDKGVGMINVGSQYDTSTRAAELAAQYKENIYAAIGIHPIHLFETLVDEEETQFSSRFERFNEVKYQALINKYTKIVAIGEIGLDYYHTPDNISDKKIKQVQKEELLKQIDFAVKNNLPIILHCRGSAENPFAAYDDLLNILITYQSSISGVIHCFGGTLEQAEKFIKLDFYIGFTGIITFGKNANSVRNVVKNISLRNILLETDSPFLTPDPYRGKRNEPAYVEFVARKIAEIKNISVEDVAEVTTSNAAKLFSLR